MKEVRAALGRLCSSRRAMGKSIARLSDCLKDGFRAYDQMQICKQRLDAVRKSYDLLVAASTGISSGNPDEIRRLIDSLEKQKYEIDFTSDELKRIEKTLVS